MTRAGVFAREELRAPFTLALLVAVPALFVVSAAGVLSDFAGALGGSLAGDAAVALSAGWAAAFISGALGYFQAASSRGADRRLALAGLGPALVADPLQGSLLVVFIFLLDAFSGPGMSGAPPVWAVSQKAGDLLIAAGAGRGSPGSDWIDAALVTVGALVAAFFVFIASARSRA
jgi:hypothetical protein